MNCPVCGAADCQYWRLRENETWHPAPEDAETYHPNLPPPGLQQQFEQGIGEAP